MDKIIDMIMGYVLNIICTGACLAIAGKFKTLVKKDEARDRLSLAMAHDVLYRYATFYIATNQITVEEMRNLTYIYEEYAAMGGNGTGKELYERCKELPIVEKRTKWNPYYLSKSDDVVA